MPLQPTDLQGLRARLLARREELRGLAEKATDWQGVVELDQSRVGRLSRMDAMQGQAMSQAAARRRAEELARIAAGGPPATGGSDGSLGWRRAGPEAEDRLQTAHPAQEVRQAG